MVMDESFRFVNTRCVFRNDLSEANVLMLSRVVTIGVPAIFGSQ